MDRQLDRQTKSRTHKGPHCALQTSFSRELKFEKKLIHLSKIGKIKFVKKASVKVIRYDFVSAVFVLYFNEHQNIRTTKLTRKRQTTFLAGQFSGAINRETYGRTPSSRRSSTLTSRPCVWVRVFGSGVLFQRNKQTFTQTADATQRNTG